MVARAELGPPLLDLNRDLIQPLFSPLCPFLMVAGHGLQALVSGLQRREAEQIAGASFLELAGNLLRHQQRPGEAAPNGLGCPVKWIASFWLGVRFWCERNDCLSDNVQNLSHFQD